MTIGTYIGMNDDGGTETDPTGGGSDPDNTMVKVNTSEYDGGAAGQDGYLTTATQNVNATTPRVTSMSYDFRGRKIVTDGEVNEFAKLYYDNLNRVVKTERYNTTAMGNLIARSETLYDTRGRVYRTIRYGVDPATGTVGNSLVDNTWYDPSGRVVKSLPAGSSQFTKSKFDSLGRSVIQYSGYDLDETSYADALTVTDDVILEQETTFNNAGSVIQTTMRSRYHNAPDTQTGPLQDPSSTPKARVAYSAAWQDGIGRTFATANYGTNGGSTLSRPSAAPASSDTVLVSLVRFDDAGNEYEEVDPGPNQRGQDSLMLKVTWIDCYR